MYCGNCGIQLNANAKFCHNCGKNIQPDISGNEKKWCYSNQNGPNGPFSTNEMIQLIKEHQIKPRNFVWKVGMSETDWLPLYRTELFQYYSEEPNNQEEKTDMFCTNCGTQLNENARFCHNCGNRIQPNTNAFDGSNYNDYANNHATTDIKINNTYVWALAIIPITVNCILSLLGFPALLNIGITFLLNTLFCSLDKEELKKFGYSNNTWFVLGLTLIPVYLFIRASKVDQKYGYAITHCCLFAFIFLL